MVENTKNPIRIDLNEFKLHIHLKKIQLTLHFNSPSRRFYLSVIALVVNEMKNLGKISSIPLERHLGQLVLLNETIGGSAGSSETENLLPRKNPINQFRVQTRNPMVQMTAVNSSVI